MYPVLCHPITAEKGRDENVAEDVSKLHPYCHLTYLLIGLLAYWPIIMTTIPEPVTFDCMKGVKVAAGCYAAPVKVLRC